ncbi:hypothetical protein N6H14_06475 [Paenibacillus sp. CC-CFT747]|nr:hypothetical protein N6H14_06475 [Paenibacillus sp. CC-CFT747]
MPNPDHTRPEGGSMEDTRAKIQEAADSTKEKLRELSGQMNEISDKIQAVPDEFGFSLPDGVESSGADRPLGTGGCTPPDAGVRMRCIRPAGGHA